MSKYKHFLGLVFDNNVITAIEKYFDLSTENYEYAFIIDDKYGINCDLFINENIK